MKRDLSCSLVVAVALLLAGGCGDNSAVGGPGATPAAQLVDVDGLRAQLTCDPDPTVEVDRSPADFVLSQVQRWVKVESLGDYQLDSERAAKGYIALMTADSAEAKPSASVVVLAAGAVPMFKQALATPGVDVYFGLESFEVVPGEVAETVMVPLAIDSSGFTWLGQCDAVAANADLDSAYGSNALEVVSSAIWRTGDDLAAVLPTPSTLTDLPAPSTPLQVVPGLTHDDKALEAFDLATLYLSWPIDSRSDEYNICVRAEGVWGSCVLLGALDGSETVYDLSFARPKGSKVDAELWLLDANVDLSRPLSLLATIPGDAFSGTAAARVTITALDLPAQAGGAVRVGEVLIEECSPDPSGICATVRGPTPN